jgi:hypothetical protein
LIGVSLLARVGGAEIYIVGASQAWFTEFKRLDGVDNLLFLSRNNTPHLGEQALGFCRSNSVETLGLTSVVALLEA